MSISSLPLVSVVTPVYNGDQYLVECIESVLSQTYDNWEYIIVNNCSTDKSLEIASSYARKDPRIRVICNKEHLGAVANWNYSVSQISPHCEYCKIVHADDWLFPECLSKMVELAEANPSVVIVSGYILAEKNILNAEIPYPSHIVEGGEIARAYLLNTFHLYLSPSSQLIRSDAIRRRQKLYDESGIIVQAKDCEMCLEFLKDADFGFIHQVLTFARFHSNSLTSKMHRYYPFFLERLDLLVRFGRFYLSEEELDACWKREMLGYSRFLGRSVFTARGKDFWQFHKEELRKLGHPITPLRLARNALMEVIRCFAEPAKHLQLRRRALRRRESISPRSL